jgi:opacity protein-like surface antigen
VIVTTSAVQKIDYLGTIRGRAGIAVGNFLVFGTAGLAVGGIKLQGSIVPVPAANPTYIGQRSQLQFGFVGGGGIEYAITYQLSIRAEFLHYDLGTQRLVLGETTGMLPGEFATMDFRSRGNVVRAGLNVRF